MERVVKSDWRLLHGTAFVLLMVAAMLVPAVRKWPWIWLAPLGSYFALVMIAAPLRRSLRWVRAGRITAASAGVTLGIIVVSSTALILFHNSAGSDMPAHGASFPWKGLGGGIVVAGLIFSFLNAAVEELVFRGILFDALESQWGTRLTIFITAGAFAAGHLHGYPPGAAGACLAGVYGIALGGLRAWTGGLILPILAHIGADATIYALLTNPVR